MFDFLLNLFIFDISPEKNPVQISGFCWLCLFLEFSRKIQSFHFSPFTIHGFWWFLMFWSFYLCYSGNIKKILRFLVYTGQQLNTRRANMNTNLVFFQFLMVSNAFQISSLWRKGKKKENQLKDCRSDECKVKQAACLQDCQRGQAKGLGFCTAMSGTYAPFIEKYGEGYARENDGYLENLISKFCFKYSILILKVSFVYYSCESWRPICGHRWLLRRWR